MAKKRVERVSEHLKHLVSEYLQHNAEKGILITVTAIIMSNDLRHAQIFVSIYPEEKETSTFRYLEEKLGELRNHVGNNVKMKFLPVFELTLDRGEKNRQRIEKIIAEHKK